MLGITTEILFEKFEIIEVLKKDEHAAVFLANHIYLSKKIILKVLNTQKLPDQAIVERFKREAKLLAKLDHPNIIKVLDFGTSKEHFYISFEYIDGTSLRNLLSAKQLTSEQKHHLMVQLLKSLDYAHTFQIIHRDIKPENIFIDNNLNLKLGDFGLALSSDDNYVTNPYSIVGTPSYMSPEQVRGAKLTIQSDLFSAGMVLFELFTGKNPFLKENITLTLNEIMSYNEESLSEGLNNLPKEIKDLLYKLLRKKPELRFASAREALNELKITVDQPTITITRDDEKKNSGKTIFWAAAVSLAVILIAFTLMNVFDKNINSPGNPPETLSSNQETKPIDQAVKTENANKDQLIPDALDKQSNEPAQNNSTTEKTSSEQVNDNTGMITYGSLFVSCLPWGNVFIDGEKVDETPMRKPITLSTGEHTLKVTHPDYPIYTSTIRIKQGEVTNVNVVLDNLMGYIKCDVGPWGNVFVNGDEKGTTPLQHLIKVVPGFVRVTIKNPSYKDIDTIFNIAKGDTVRLKFTFKK